MLNFTVPRSLDDCVRRLEIARQERSSPIFTAKVDLSQAGDKMIRFRYELFLAVIPIAFARGVLVGESESSTRVQGMAMFGAGLQLLIFASFAVAFLVASQWTGDPRNRMTAVAIVFLVGPALSFFGRRQVGETFKRVLLG